MPIVKHDDMAGLPDFIAQRVKARARDARRRVNKRASFLDRLRLTIDALENMTTAEFESNHRDHVSVGEIKQFFDRTPGISMDPDTDDIYDALLQAEQLFELFDMKSFVSVSAFRIPVGSTTVNLLLLGEDHSNTNEGQSLMRYIMGQVALEKKCVDLYLEDSFDFQPVRRRQYGGSALTNIRKDSSLNSVDGLRVHRVDVRIGTSGVGNPYLIRNFPLASKYYRTIKGVMNELDLFRITVGEYYRLFTGFAIPSTPHDRAIFELERDYERDSKRLAGVLYDVFGERVYSNMPKIFKLGHYATIRARFAKQRRRFLKTTGMPSRKLERLLVGWLKPIIALGMGLTPGLHAVQDLYAFLRMFGTFTERNDRENKRGCPMEQRNIVYVAGAAHVNDHLAPLIRTVFGAKPFVTAGMADPAVIERIKIERPSRGAILEVTTEQVRDMDSLEIF